MVLTDFTTYDDIRAALGVNRNEISDITLSLELYANGLNTELRRLSPLLPAYYSELPSDASALTDLQRHFQVTTRMFAVYAVAKHLTISLPLFSPRDVTDGKAAMGRYNSDPYKQVISGVMAQYEQYKNDLIEAYRALDVSMSPTAAVPISGMRVVTPAYDPVTG